MALDGLYCLETKGGKILHVLTINPMDKQHGQIPFAHAVQNGNKQQYTVKIWWNSLKMALGFQFNKTIYLLVVNGGKLMLVPSDDKKPDVNKGECWFNKKNVGGDTHYYISTDDEKRLYITKEGAVELNSTPQQWELVTHTPVQDAD